MLLLDLVPFDAKVGMIVYYWDCAWFKAQVYIVIDINYFENIIRCDYFQNNTAHMLNILLFNAISHFPPQNFFIWGYKSKFEYLQIIFDCALYKWTRFDFSRIVNNYNIHLSVMKYLTWKIFFHLFFIWTTTKCIPWV